MKETNAFFGPDKAFFTPGSLIFASSFAFNALSYGFILLVARLLSVEEFGDFSLILSLFLIISVPATALSMFMSREAASHFAEGSLSIRYVFYYLRPHVLVFNVLLWILLLALTPFFSTFFHVSSELVVLLSVLVPLTLAASLHTGALEGMQKFFLVTKQRFLFATVLISGSVALVLTGLSVRGVITALVLAAGARWLYGFFATYEALLPKNQGTIITTRSEVASRPIAPIFVTTLLLTLLLNVDVLFANHYLAPTLAGEYAALSVLGKILLMSIGAFITAFLPFISIVPVEVRGKEHRMLVLSLSILCACSIALWAFVSLFPGFFVSFLFGASYMGIVPYVTTVVIGIACIAVSIVFISYFVAVRNTSFLYCLAVGVLMEMTLLTLSADSIEGITRMVAASAGVLLFLLNINYLLVVSGFGQKVAIFLRGTELMEEEPQTSSSRG